MSCASCASSSQVHLKHQIGVVDANVNYATSTGKIEFIPSLTNPKKLKNSLISTGYDLLIEEYSNQDVEIEELKKDDLRSLKLNVMYSLVFGIPLFLMGMFFMDISYSNYILWTLSTPILFIFGKQFYIRAWKQLKNRSSNMDTLVALSTSVAYIFSVFNTLYPSYWDSKGLQFHTYFETSGLIVRFTTQNYSYNKR